jgi:hypothetical protein
LLAHDRVEGFLPGPQLTVIGSIDFLHTWILRRALSGATAASRSARWCCVRPAGHALWWIGFVDMADNYWLEFPFLW